MADRARWLFAGVLIEGSVRMSSSPGVVPDQGVLVQPYNDTQPSTVIGDLVLQWGNTGAWATVRTWEDCHICRAEQASNQYRDTVYQIKDRRWLWQYRFIHGSYNVMDEHNVVDPATARNPRELATLLLQAMGESGYDVSVLPVIDSLAPQVTWFYSNAAVELHKLCGLYGVDVHLTKENPVELKARGTGLVPGSSNLERPVEAAIALEQSPEKIRAYAADTLFDSWLELEAVAPEFTDDGSLNDIKLINDLSFKPATGWVSADVEHFVAVTGATAEETKQLRAHCQRYMWKMFRIKGFAKPATKPPGFDADTNPETGFPWPDVTNMKLLLPLKNTRLAAGLDEFGFHKRLPAELAGSFCDWEHGGSRNTKSYHQWPYGFRIDTNGGYVYTSRPFVRRTPVVFAYSNLTQLLASTGYAPTQRDVDEWNSLRDKETGKVYQVLSISPLVVHEVKKGWYPPVIYLRTGYGLRQEFHGPRYHHTYTLETGIANNSGIEPLRKTEFQRICIEEYTEDYIDLSVTGTAYDNKTDVEIALLNAATERSYRYDPTLEPQTGRYVVPYDIETDGRVSQITWEAGAEAAFIQTVSVGCEHDRGQLPAMKRFEDDRRRKVDELALMKFTDRQDGVFNRMDWNFEPESSPSP